MEIVLGKIGKVDRCLPVILFARNKIQLICFFRDLCRFCRGFDAFCSVHILWYLRGTAVRFYMERHLDTWFAARLVANSNSRSLCFGCWIVLTTSWFQPELQKKNKFQIPTTIFCQKFSSLLWPWVSCWSVSTCGTKVDSASDFCLCGRRLYVYTRISFAKQYAYRIMNIYILIYW